MVSAWRANGDLMAYLRKNPDADRVDIVGILSAREAVSVS